MELIYPWILAIGVVVVIGLLMFKPGRKSGYINGKKVANVNLVEETEFYQKLKKQYTLYRTLAGASLLLAIVGSFVLVARPAEVEQVNAELQNRDIFLCLDVSNSVDQLNVEMCDELRNVIRKLNGERFGITIFNAKSVLLVPLTDDYDYVLSVLDKLEASFRESLKFDEDNYDIFNSDFDYDAYFYKFEGTLSEEGSSYIGDGLASCLYNFPDLTENDARSRMIIFTTDNELNGTPHVTVDEAVRLCKKNDVTVFSIAPDNIVDENSFKSSIESTGGKYYRNSSASAYDNLLKDIEKIETSSMTKVETVIYDQPQAVFVCVLLCVAAYFLLSRKVKL